MTAMERTACITSSMVVIDCPRKTRSDSATATNIQPIIQGGEVCMGTATTLAVLTRIWDLHIGSGEDYEPTSASRIGAHTTAAAVSAQICGLDQSPGLHEKAPGDAGALSHWEQERAISISRPPDRRTGN